jgi:hypothetical protein
MSDAPASPIAADPPVEPTRTTEPHYWVWVLCILGLDYFSTLAYQPSITFRETGKVGPLATLAVVFVTLFGALPIYCYLAGRSPVGQGSLGIVEKLVRGWRGKTLVLILLGFAATDFTMLKALSTADASVHIINRDGNHSKHFANWLKDCTKEYCGDDIADPIDEKLVVTLCLSAVAFVFWFLLRKGFNRNVLFMAVPLVLLYLLMTAAIIGAGIWVIAQRPEIFHDWLDQMQRGDFGEAHAGDDGWWTVILVSLLALPNLALGLSGFELSMILMPQVKGELGEQPPVTRIWNTRKVLIVAAVVMSLFLLGSVLVTTLLIPPDALKAGKSADNRALAYLAHGGNLAFDEPNLADGEQARPAVLPFSGVIFGTAYDIVTILVLCLAGTSVMTGLAVLLPQFLMRFGMELRWANRWGVMLILFALINMGVTIVFHASVDQQRGAYATGVLVLIACAAVVTVMDKRRTQEESGGMGFFGFLDIAYFSFVAFIFVTTMLAVAMGSAAGLGIALCFIFAILTMSILSRAWRADELRTMGYEFKDEQSKFLWDSLRLADFPILVPVHPGLTNHDYVEMEIRAQHQLAREADIVFLEIEIDDPSDFFQTLILEVARQENRYFIKVTNGVSVAHAIAAVALEMSRYSKPPGLHFGWPERDMLSASWSYLAFGAGNIPWKVRELIHRAESDPTKRPRVIVG